MTREQFIRMVQAEQESLRRFLLSLCCGNRDEADDIAQDALVKAYLSLSKHEERGKGAAWLYRIAYNTFLDAVRSRRTLQPLEEARASHADAAFCPLSALVPRSGSIIDSTVGESKIIKIQREIGRQPVLAFGNSSGDFAMLNYTINNNKYKSAAFILLCDDTEREFGNLSKAAKTKAAADTNGWIAISMRNDFKTIYGYDILKY